MLRSTLIPLAVPARGAWCRPPAALPPVVQELVGPLSEGKCELVPHTVTLDYSYLSAEQVLRVRRVLLPRHHRGATLHSHLHLACPTSAARLPVCVRACVQKLLPAGVDPPGSFEQVGHIAHLNLKEEQLPHKLLIGQVSRH